MKKVIVLTVETDIMVFSTLEKMEIYLQNSEDEALTPDTITRLVQDHILSTAYASYSWDWFNVD